MKQHIESIAGVPVSLYTAGDNSAPPVVLLHGGGLMGSTWGRVADILADRHRCIAPDLRGHGDTAWSPDGQYTLAGYARDLADLLSHFGIDRPHVVGMSQGGQAALFAACHGLPVRSLTLVDVGPQLDDDGARLINEFSLTEIYSDLEEAVDATHRFNPRRSRESIEASVRRAMRQSPDGSWTWKWDSRRRTTQLHRTQEAVELWPLVRELNVPTLVVRGGDSVIFTAALASEFVAALPDGRLATVEGSGHAVQSDRPDDLAGVLAQFLMEVDRVGGRGGRSQGCGSLDELAPHRLGESKGHRAGGCHVDGQRGS